ncbi:MAG: PHP domain-containing protein [Christensenellales bacterium]
MQLFGDYHTHTGYSDGRGSMEDVVRAAIACGLKEVTISDHSFTSPSIGALTVEKYKKQREQLPKLREKYPQISILHSVEANILNYEGTIDLPAEVMGELDIIIAGFHLSAWPGIKDWYSFIWKGVKSKFIAPSAAQRARNTAALINTIKKYDIDVLAHPDSVLRTDIKDVAKACADYGTLFEINVKHLDSLSPLLEDILSTDVTLIANTDAHYPERVGEFSKVRSFIAAHNIEPSRIANWESGPRFRSQRRV